MSSPYYQQTRQDYDYNTQDPRQYEQSQPHVYTQQQPYPSSSFPTPHNIPPPPPLPGSSYAFIPPSAQPISAPTPQYPHYFNPASPGAPTSPNGAGPGPFRRPLPTPGAPGQTTIIRSPLPTPGPTPGPSKLAQPTQPMPVAGPSKIPAVPAASSSPVQSPISPGHSPRRPLPIPLPRSPNGVFPENGTRSPSPVRNPTSPSQEASPASPTKFVPYWKRNLPSPNGGSDAAVAGPSSISATIAGNIGRNSGSQPVASGSRSKSVDNGRPLPPSPAVSRPSRMREKQPVAGPSTFRSAFQDEQPVAGPSNSSPRSPKVTNGYASMSEQPVPGPSKIHVASPTPMSPRKPYAPAHAPSPSRSDTDDTNSRTPSPQYGIRDLPAKSRSIINHNKARHMRESASTEHDGPDEPVRGRPGRSSTLPQPPAAPVLSSPVSRQRSGHRPTQSVTLRATAVFSAVPAASTRKTAGSTPVSPSGWPAGLPPLPRAPASPYTKQYAVPHVMNNRREYVNLDEPPPPSLRRSPSPSSSPRTAAASPRVPNFRSSQPTVTAPPLPPRKGSASNPPSPKKFTNTLPNVPSLPQRRDNTSGTSRGGRFASPERRQAPTSAPVATPFSSQNRSQSSFVQQRLDHRQISPERKPELTTSVPNITFSRNPDFDDDDDINDAWSDGGAPMIAVSAPEEQPASPQITFAPPIPSPMGFGGSPFPMRGAGTQTKRKVSAPNSNPDARGSHSSLPSSTVSTGRSHPPPSSARRGGGMACGGCGGPIVGRIVSAMGVRWHPGCFRCCVCNDLLEYISSFEHDGKPYCHLDYHELFAPRCYHCKTAIVDERFITLDDPELGKRTYHEQHFFCSECGEPFLTPSLDRQPRTGTGPGGGLTFTGDGEFEDDNVGFTVHRGYPYCEACHVRLRSPKCTRCKQSIRGGQQAVDALGGKWHWECFTCTSCEKPFEDPSFFLRDNKPFCESCFSIIIKSEL